MQGKLVYLAIVLYCKMQNYHYFGILSLHFVR